MGKLNRVLAAGLVIVLAGCTTSSQVQEMIDASQRDFLQKSEENAASVDVLKQAAKASLEKDSEHAVAMRELRKQLAEATAALDAVTATAEATKLMSASSVVKIAELEEALEGNKTVLDVYIEKMRENDELYTQVLTDYFRQVAERANASLASLQAANPLGEDEAPLRREPIPLAEPIEIVAPDTSAPTNAVSGE